MQVRERSAFLAGTEEGRPTGGGIKRVLVVDDDPTFRRRLTKVLLRLGFDSLGVGGVPAALRTLGEVHIDVILLDVHLKGHTGHSLLRGLDKTGLDLPVVMMSGVGTMQDVVEALRHHASDWLTKPFEPEELWESLNRAIQAQGRQRHRGRPARSTESRSPRAGHAPLPVDEGDPREDESRMGDPEAPRRDRSSRLAAAPVVTPPDAEPIGTHERDIEARPEPSEPAADEVGDQAGTTAPLSQAELMRALGKLSERIKDGTIELPPLDPVALELQELFESPAPGIGEVLAVVERDPSVAAAMLRLANSIRFQGGKAALTLKAACIRLGNRRVLTIAQEVMVKELFAGDGEFGEMANAMWENVLVTSQGARLLAERLTGLDPDEVHLAALFHNMGELVLLRVLRKLAAGRHVSDKDLALFSAELGKRHEDVGALLLKTWGISPGFVHLAGGHHKKPLAPETRGVRLLREVVHLAWQMALRVGFDYLPGQEIPEPVAEVEALGLEWDDVEELFGRAGEWVG
jgi:HD-like signal output (HDOD) protein/DNA-binding response OmpR family regulator